MEDSSLFEVVRVSRDGKSAIIKRSDNHFEALSLETGANLHPSTTSFPELSSLGSWRKVTSDEVEALVASIEMSSMDIITEVPKKSNPYRVPSAVKAEVATALEHPELFSAEDLQYANALAFNDTVGEPEIQWVDSFFNQYDQPQRLRGGYKGQKWAAKILHPTDDEMFGDDVYDDTPEHNRYDFDDDTFTYYAVGPDADETIAEELLAIDFETGTVYIWGPDGFEIMDGQDYTDIEAPQLILIDEYTAEALARYIDEGTGDYFDVVDVDPEERNLFSTAESSIDFEELARLSEIIVAAGTVDPTVPAGAKAGKYGGIDLVPNQYTPEERSINAKRQVRGQGGKFGGPQIKPGVKLLGFTKARLDSPLPLVENPAGRIQEFLNSAPVTAAGMTSATGGAANPNPAPTPAPAPATAPASTPQQEAVDKATGPDTTQPILYFAIVDNADKTAVLNCVAISKDQQGQPAAWVRENSAWSSSPSILSQLMGSTPPPVVELTDPNQTKQVLAQIDQHDSTKDQFPTDAIPNSQPTAPTAPAQGSPTAAPTPVAASAWLHDMSVRGYALPDGSMPILDAGDLMDAVANFASFPDEVSAKAHIRKRARALNRMDLVPVEWREATLGELGEMEARRTPLFSEFGELIETNPSLTASANPARDAVSTERLMRYWAYGKGAAKIRWGTRGDLTRAHRHLSKYISPKLAWGLAQNLHKRVFGMSNAKHDKLTGQR